MSDNFIPLNQSTPVRGGSFERNQHHQQHMPYQNNWNHKYQNRRSNNNFNRSNRWGNSQRSNSFGSDYNNSPGQDNRNSIDAYLHPSMLQDPWANLREETK